MRFVSRVCFRRLGFGYWCDFTEVCVESQGVRSHIKVCVFTGGCDFAHAGCKITGGVISRPPCEITGGVETSHAPRVISQGCVSVWGV
jgi:hypothetical protein